MQQSSSDMDRFSPRSTDCERRTRTRAAAARQSVPSLRSFSRLSNRRSRPRVVAELAEPVSRPTDLGFGPCAPDGHDRPESRRLADGVCRDAAGRHRRRPRGDAAHVAPASDAKNPFAKNLTTLLGTGQASRSPLSSEVLSTPKSKEDITVLQTGPESRSFLTPVLCSRSLNVAVARFSVTH